jgi:hypothetical protein
MAIPNVSSSSQALASYAAQLQSAQQRNPAQTSPTSPRDQSNTTQSSDRVTLSAQSSQAPNRNAELQVNRDNAAERTSSAQAVERKQLDNPEATRSAASKSVTQALEAYVQTSLI